MRNYFAIAFTCVYLILTVGVAKTTHYCMGRLSHTSLFSFQAEKCACAVFQKANSMSCCNDKLERIVLADDQNQGSIISPHSPDYFELGTAYSDQMLTPGYCVKEPAATFFSDSSPPVRGSLFKLHCSFVFYG